MYMSRWLAAAITGGMFAGACCQVQETNGSDIPWYREPFGLLQTIFRQSDANMNIDNTTSYIVEHGADAWLISVGGILANYPSELDFQAVNPELANVEGGDLIQSCIDSAHSKDLRVLGRMDFSKIPLSIAEEHPDWLFVSHNGSWQTHPHDTVSVCPNGDYYQNRTFEIMGEVIDRYELDGFFVNWVSFNTRDYFRNEWGVCHCDNCKARWHEYAGDEELPKEKADKNYAKWTSFTEVIINDWTGRMTEFVTERNPNAMFMLGESANVRFFETNNELDREFWGRATSETASTFISFKPDVPMLINSAAFLGHGYRFAVENSNNYAQYHLQAISRGGNPSTYIIGEPQTVPWTNLGAAKEIVQFHKANRDVYRNMRPVAKTAIILPEDPETLDESHYEDALLEYKGLYTAMAELHIPFDIIAQKYISRISENGGLKRYSTLILPGLGTMLADDIQALDDWVDNGGTLIATTPVGLDADDNVQLQSLPALHQKKNITHDLGSWGTYMAPDDQPRQDQEYYNGPLIPILWQHQFFDWKEDSEGLYKMLGYAPFAPMEYVYGHRQTEERGAGIGSFGNGTGVVIPFPVGHGYLSTGEDYFRDFIELILSKYGAKEQLTFDLPDQVELTVNVNDNATVVHLINMSGLRYQNFGTHLPIPPGSSMSIADDGDVRVRALVKGEDLEVSNGKVELPAMDLFEVLVIEDLG